MIRVDKRYDVDEEVPLTWWWNKRWNTFVQWLYDQGEGAARKPIREWDRLMESWVMGVDIPPEEGEEHGEAGDD